MTKNQIDYLNYLESKRSNMKTEELTQIRDANNYRVSLDTLAETQRAHRADEQIRFQTLGETRRANVARETENYRSNTAKEQQAMNELTETKRSHQATEAVNIMNAVEQQRSHQANESIQIGYNDAYVAELIRSHRAQEAENARNNTLQHVDRVAKVNYDYAYLQQLYNVLAETERHNQSTEAITQTNNLLTNKLQREKQTEDKRHNLQSELQASENLRQYMELYYNQLNSQRELWGKEQELKWEQYFTNTELELSRQGLQATDMILSLLPKGRYNVGGYNYENKQNSKEESSNKGSSKQSLGQGQITLNGQPIYLND